jgi:hypothetical protein
MSGSAIGGMWSFFLKPKVGDDAFDAARADLDGRLAHLLGDDLGGRIGIEEAVADNLTDDIFGARGGRFWARLAAEKSGSTARGESVAELEIALFAEAELLGSLEGTEAEALAFDEHEEFVGDLVVNRDRQRTLWADQERLLGIEVKHGSTCEVAEGAVFFGSFSVRLHIARLP